MPSLNWKGKNEFKKYTNINHNDITVPLQLIEQNTILLNHKSDHTGKKSKSIDCQVEDDWRNLLIWGDNLLVLESLRKNFGSKINLIYIDPPFRTGGGFNYRILIGKKSANESSRAYSDNWRGGIDTYLNFMYKRLWLMKSLLADNACIFVQLDWHVSHYVKIMLDEIFGEGNFRNEIIWAYPAASVQSRRFFIRSFDVILFYSNSEEYTFNNDPEIYMEFSDRVKNALKTDEKGQFYYRGGSHNGKKLTQKVYIKEKGIFPRDVWKDIPYIRANTQEYQGFSTQKPERLLKRIILASTNTNDLIADFFCGSGTSLVVAEKLGRRWIGCDSSQISIHITKKRVLSIYEGNDLINWKVKYQKQNQPFRVLHLKGSKKREIVPKEFLIQEIITNSDSNLIEKPRLIVSIHRQNNGISVELEDYVIPKKKLIKKSILESITRFSDWIDYWAVDFNHQKDFFNIMWASYRIPKSRELALKTDHHSYDKLGSYEIVIKSVDIFGIESVQTHLISIE